MRHTRRAEVTAIGGRFQELSLVFLGTQRIPPGCRFFSLGPSFLAQLLRTKTSQTSRECLTREKGVTRVSSAFSLFCATMESMLLALLFLALIWGAPGKVPAFLGKLGKRHKGSQNHGNYLGVGG